MMETALTSAATVTRLQALLTRMVSDTALHTRWLNTLSYLEHVGATKIARTQSGPQAGIITLKHAAEEARHAYYLKKLCLRLDPEACPDYAPEHLLCPGASRHLLHRLDIQVSRRLRAEGLSGYALKRLAYLLVTYAIEVRADEMYPVYQAFLDELPVKISVQSIINEEEGHLAEMEAELATYPAEMQALKPVAIAMEQALFGEWLAALEREIP